MKPSATPAPKLPEAPTNDPVALEIAAFTFEGICVFATSAYQRTFAGGDSVLDRHFQDFLPDALVPFHAAIIEKCLRGTDEMVLPALGGHLTALRIKREGDPHLCLLALALPELPEPSGDQIDSRQLLHDIKNDISALLGAIHLAERFLAEQRFNELTKSLELAKTSASRLRDLVNSTSR